MTKLLGIILAGVTLLAPLSIQAQLGGLGKAVGGKVTAESLNADITAGMDFFLEASIYYSKAILPEQEAAKKEAEFRQLMGTTNSKALTTASEQIRTKAEELAKAGVKLDKEAKDLIKNGDKELRKGVTKWAVLGGALAIAATSGGEDAALAVAIPVAEQAAKDLPEIKKMGDAIKALNKIK